MKIKVTFICLFCAFTLRIVAQNKHALVVAIIGYSIKLETRSGTDHLRFMGDKMQVLNTLNGYISS